jgi:hypothetical protein
VYPADGPQAQPRVWHLDQSHYDAAAEDALRRYPGPVGELLHREITAYARFGHQFATDGDALIPHLTTHLLSPPGTVPDPLPPRPTPGPTLWPCARRTERLPFG